MSAFVSLSDLAQFCAQANDVTLYANNARAQADAGNKAQATRFLSLADQALANLCEQYQDQKPVLSAFVERVRGVVNGPPQVQQADAAQRQDVANQYAAAGQAAPDSYALPASSVPVAQTPTLLSTIESTFSSPSASPCPAGQEMVYQGAVAAGCADPCPDGTVRNSSTGNCDPLAPTPWPEAPQPSPPPPSSAYSWLPWLGLAVGAVAIGGAAFAVLRGRAAQDETGGAK